MIEIFIVTKNILLHMMPPDEPIYSTFSSADGSWNIVFTDRRVIFAYTGMSTVATVANRTIFGPLLRYPIRKASEAHHRSRLHTLSPDEILFSRKGNFEVLYKHITQVAFKRGVFGCSLTLSTDILEKTSFFTKTFQHQQQHAVDIKRGDYDQLFSLCTQLFPGKCFGPEMPAPPQASAPAQSLQQTPTQQHIPSYSQQLSNLQQPQQPQTIQIQCMHCGQINTIIPGQESFVCSGCGVKSVKK